MWAEYLKPWSRLGRVSPSPQMVQWNNRVPTHKGQSPPKRLTFPSVGFGWSKLEHVPSFQVNKVSKVQREDALHMMMHVAHGQ